MVIAQNPHITAVVELLETATFAGAPLRVGDGVAPKSTDRKIVAPSVIVFGRPGGSLISSVGCLDTDGVMRFQTTSVGRSAAEAREVDDKARATLTASALTVEDRACTIRPNDSSSSTERDDDVIPSLFYVVSMYRLLTFSAV